MEAQKSTNPFDSIEQKLSSIESHLTEITQTLLTTSTAEKKYYTISEAAERLNVAPITLYRNGQKGKIPIKKIGQRVMIPGSYVDR